MYYGLEPYLIDHPWILSLIWMVLYTSDYYLTLVGARLHKKQDYYRIEGSYELTPQYQKDIDKGNKFSLRFLALLLFFAAYIYVLAQYLDAPKYLVGIFAGLLIITELPVHARHIQNIMFYRRLASSNPGTTGQLAVTKEYGYRQSATQLACCGVLVFLIFLLTGSWMLLGGALGLLNATRQHISLARKHARMTDAANKENAQPPRAEEQV